MTAIIEDLALLLARDEARKQLEPKGCWPTSDDACITFAGRDMTQEDLAEIVFEKYRDLFITEATTILSTRSELRQDKLASILRNI